MIRIKENTVTMSVHVGICDFCGQSNYDEYRSDSGDYKDRKERFLDNMNNNGFLAISNESQNDTHFLCEKCLESLIKAINKSTCFIVKRK